MLYQLAVNTSQSRAQLILIQDKEIMDEVTWEKKNSHSEIITVEFQKLLTKHGLSITDIKKVFCIQGPGSFTGVRVGVTFCKSLAFSNNMKIEPINALDGLAAPLMAPGRTIHALIDAQKNSVFISTYQCIDDKKFQYSLENAVVKVEDLEQWLIPKSYLCGHAHDRYPKILEVCQAKEIQTHSQHSKDLLNFSLFSPYFSTRRNVTWEELQPLYIKASAPEEIRNPSEKWSQH